MLQQTHSEYSVIVLPQMFALFQNFSIKII